MDFRRQKLYLAIIILAAGMLVASVWHGWQLLVLHREYPFGTFLFNPAAQFSDLTEVVKNARLPSPYQNHFMGYLPATYVVFRYLGFLGPATGTYLFLSISSLGLLAVSIAAFRPVIIEPSRFVFSWFELIAASEGLLLLSYSYFISVDRANIELVMVLLASLALFCFRHRCFRLGLLCLFPAACFKFYPILLTLLFLRSRHFHKVIIFCVAFLLVTIFSLAIFAKSMSENWALWHKNVSFIQYLYVLHNFGLAGSASPWNAGKAILATCLFLSVKAPTGMTIVFSEGYVSRLYTIYMSLAFVSSLTVILYVVFIETEFFRRAIALLILVTLAVPSGGDYRLLYANVALSVLILLPTRRLHDFFLTGLLAFVLVPKKEVFFPFLGTSDSGYFDVSLAVIINPPCLLAALFLFLGDGFRNQVRPEPWQKYRRMVNSLSLSFGRRASTQGHGYAKELVGTKSSPP